MMMGVYDRQPGLECLLDAARQPVRPYGEIVAAARGL
jgi:hypothetical protein